jgi:hypothetical protein
VTRSYHHFEAVEPLMVTCYGSDGRVLMRKGGLRQGKRFDIPKQLRKRIARTETVDARGRTVDTWTAPWPVEASADMRKDHRV